ncbi:alpha/beta hydrolase [Mycetocola tolaasinivorans]|uniref:Alpha/beta hydrolase n=1 Tax=Mycetocola tolaasinivorans TaxID=76635 RepID=A0A3L7AD19_9MICO|nr:alpha/beta hydrolase [Mycetocola tolaasinivorans]RLP77551.1 alpha/beta hydrolase [Mycetocola tolaasinivorans]
MSTAPETPTPLHPDMRAWLDAVRQDTGPGCRELGAARVRGRGADRAAARLPGPAMAAILETTVGEDVRVRRYEPADADTETTIVYLHGGGFVVGDLASHDALCRRLAAATGTPVVAVDYRRAPEHPAPAAVDDAIAAVEWAHLTSARVALAGDSAGGAIALLATARLHARGERVHALLLGYPMTDMSLSFPSVETYGTGHGLDAADLDWYIEQWVPAGIDRSAASVSPISGPVSGFPPTLLVAAELDPLHDEAIAFAHRLQAAGTLVSVRTEPGLPHGFLVMVDALEPARLASERAFTEFAELLTALHS